MDKIKAIGLLLAFLFYHLGYYFIYESLNRNEDQSWGNRLSQNDLNGEIFLQRSLPITFPYQADNENFVNLKFEYEGKVYRVLKYRYEKDTLHILYIRDLKGDLLNKSFSDWASTFTQKPITGKSSPRQQISIEKIYLPRIADFNLSIPVIKQTALLSFYKEEAFSTFLEVQVPPPKLTLIS